MNIQYSNVILQYFVYFVQLTFGMS